MSQSERCEVKHPELSTAICVPSLLVIWSRKPLVHETVQRVRGARKYPCLLEGILYLSKWQEAVGAGKVSGPPAMATNARKFGFGLQIYQSKLVIQ